MEPLLIPTLTNLTKKDTVSKLLLHSLSFTHVLNFLPSSDIIKLQMLNRFLYKIGIPRFLKSINIQCKQPFAYDPANHALKLYNPQSNLVSIHTLKGKKFGIGKKASEYSFKWTQSPNGTLFVVRIEENSSQSEKMFYLMVDKVNQSKWELETVYKCRTLNLLRGAVTSAGDDKIVVAGNQFHPSKEVVVVNI